MKRSALPGRVPTTLAAATLLAACAAATPDAKPVVVEHSQPQATTLDVADSMRPARLVGKMGAPVDVRYRFATAPRADEPVVLDLAVQPRVAGTNLQYELRVTQGVRLDAVAAGPLASKASAGTIYQRSVSVTATDPAGEDLQVLVSMDLDGASAFGIYEIDLVPSTSAKTLKKRQQ